MSPISNPSPQSNVSPPCILEDRVSIQPRPQRISVAPSPAQTRTIFGSHFTAIPQNVNFNVQSPVVTLAPVATQQRQLLLPAKLIKSESVVYPRGAQAITSTPVSHQIHTLVNTANGAVLTTGTNIITSSKIFSVLISLLHFRNPSRLGHRQGTNQQNQHKHTLCCTKSARGEEERSQCN